MLQPLLEIAGPDGVRWGLTVHKGAVLALQQAGGPDKLWQPMGTLPVKLAEYMPTFVDQHQPWLLPTGMPTVANNPDARARRERIGEVERQKERNREAVAQAAQPQPEPQDQVYQPDPPAPAPLPPEPPMAAAMEAVAAKVEAQARPRAWTRDELELVVKTKPQREASRALMAIARPLGINLADGNSNSFAEAITRILERQVELVPDAEAPAQEPEPEEGTSLDNPVPSAAPEPQPEAEIVKVNPTADRRGDVPPAELLENMNWAALKETARAWGIDVSNKTSRKGILRGFEHIRKQEAEKIAELASQLTGTHGGVI